ncbi:shikimate kinase [Acrocarpospora phusangensis]|uniref:Shikimate kinase n=1 Tax=Acrocarpospora phusangensis TaxID=1070424 RepID=A0A919QG20_9ACTN|nr:shikimate kinase [Acrocarpospora phusangensis]
MVIVGLMGAGKSTVGRLVADALGRDQRDSDADLHDRYGLTAAEIAATLGADVLHEREARVLRAALDRRPPLVIGAAASTVEDAEARQALRRAFVVFLDGPPALLAERMRSSAHRPHFLPDLERMLTEQRERRLPYFVEVADLTADATRPAEEIAAQVLAALDD